MLDLLIVTPGGRDAIYQALGEELTAVEPPLWARLIAGYIRDRGWSVEILDSEAMLLSPEKAAKRAQALSPKLVAVVAYGHQPSASTQSMAWVTAFCRNEFPCSVLVVGGHASALPEQTARETGALVCIGEGPVTIDDLLRPGRHNDARGLLALMDDGSFVRCPPAPNLPVESLHGAAWDLLHMDLYRAHNWQVMDGSPRTPYASIYTSLGCPFACSFCCINAPFGGKGYRMRHPADVVAEIAYLYTTYGVRTFKITDEMFVLKKAHYTAICEGLAGMFFADELNIWAYARIDTVKADTLPLMRRAGIRWLALGIESGSAHVRDGADKSLSNDDIVSTVRAIQDAGISVLANLIYGLPDDTAETMQATLDLALGLNCEFSNHYSAMPYPGSRLYSETPPEHLPRTWSGYSQHSVDSQPLPTETLTSADVLRFRDHAFQTCFTSQRYIDMIGEKFGPAAVAQIQAMTSRRLERALLAA